MRIGNGTVEENFGVSNSNSGRAYVLVGLKFVAADSHADPIDFGIVGTHGTDEVDVCHFSSSRDLTRFDKKNCLRTLNSFGRRSLKRYALSAATYFVCEQSFPN